jgi:hypothetical protein
MFPRYDPEQTQPELGTSEWHRAQMAELRAKAIKKHMDKKR